MPTHEDRASSRHRRTLLVFVALLVCLRGFLVASAADVFGYGEEFAKGGAAKAILDGLPVPYHQLNYAYHEGGGFLVSHLEALGFLLLGPCVLVVKLVAIGFAVATLLAGAWMLTEHVSTRAAYVFAALLALAPQSFQQVSLLALGTHVEASLFILLAFHFTARSVRKEAPSRSAPFWLGLVGGFGCYVGLQMPAVLFVCGLAILACLRGRALVPVVARGVPGFVIGAIPLWWMIAKLGPTGVLIHRAAHAPERPGWIGSFVHLLGPIVRSSDPLTWLQACAYALVIVWGLVLRRTRLQWMLSGYVLVFVVGWCTSGLAVPYDGTFFYVLRLVPPWIAVTCLAASACDTLWSAGGHRRVVAIVTLAIGLVAGAKGTIALAREARPSAPRENLSMLLRTPGYSYQEYFLQVEWHFDGTATDKARVFLHSKDDPKLLVPDLSNALYSMHSAYASEAMKHRTLEDVLPELDQVFGPNRDLALLGLGMLVHGNWSFDFPAAYARIERLPEELREPLAESLGRAGVGPAFRADRLHRHLAIVPPERWHDAWWRGIGWRFHRTFRFRPDRALAALAALEDRDRIPATIGYEAAVRVDRLE